VAPAVFYYRKAFGAFAEFVRSAQVVTADARAIDVANQAWQVAALVNLTGEPASAALVSPKSPFDPPAGQFGAWQIVARHARLAVDKAAFATVASPSASRSASQTTIGLNWYPAQFVKYAVNYERTTFDGHPRAARSTEHAIYMRAQLSF